MSTLSWKGNLSNSSGKIWNPPIFVFVLWIKVAGIKVCRVNDRAHILQCTRAKAEKLFARREGIYCIYQKQENEGIYLPHSTIAVQTSKG